MHIKLPHLLVALMSVSHVVVLADAVTKEISPDGTALDIADAAVKTSPKDNTGNVIAESSESDKFNKPEPKSNLDADKSSDGSIDTDLSESSGRDSEKMASDDYDPNKLGKQETKSGSTNKVVDELADAKHNAKDSGAASVSGSQGSSLSGGQDTGGSTSQDGAKSTATDSSSAATDAAGEKSAYNSLVMSFSMIIFSEIGDKTFLIAALMAMKHPRVTVFSAAFTSLVLMTVLSAVMGHALPTFLPEHLTKFMAAVLFAVFGVKLLREGLAMDQNSGVDEEMEEVECEIEASEINMRNDLLESGEKIDESNGGLRRIMSSPKVSADGLEMGQIPPSPRGAGRHPSGSFKGAIQFFTEGLNNLASLMLSPVWVQVFAMTFLGEWGDRSQVATIAMAAGSDYWFVIIGAIVGHGICTLAAVIGGKLLATKISMRTVTICGAVSFLIFSVIYFIEGFTAE